MKRFYLAVLAISIAGSVVWLHGRYIVKSRPAPELSQAVQQDYSADNGGGSADVSLSLPAFSATEKSPISSSENPLLSTTASSNEALSASSVSTVSSDAAVRRPRGRLADPAYRAKQVRKHSSRFKHEQAEAVARSKKEGWHPVDPGEGQLMAIKNGKPLVYQVENANASISTAANVVNGSAIYGVDGSNIVVGIWDEGSVRSTHREFGGRVSLMDGAALSSHSTHVCGTVAAVGVTASAKGMATAVNVESYDWNNDLSQMTSRAMADPSETDKIQISNHSYGYTSGWNWLSSPVSWYGTWSTGVRESDNFGIYSDEPANLDALCYDAPYYLPVKSSGNDRNDNAPNAGTLFQYYDSGFRTKTYDPATDPWADYGKGGFDTISIVGNAKNILTVGSVADAVSGGNRSVANAAMQPYSGWGPTDDGRVKPDIVANGASVYSTDSGNDSAYTTKQGTSMAAPNAMGSAALLIEYYKKMLGTPITSALLKGLIIHTADDLGPAGPDYMNGWGLMNTKQAAEYIRLHSEYPLADIMYEDFLDSTNVSNDILIESDTVNPLKVTICWTDPAGDGQVTLNNRTPVLVNDLDLRIVDPNGVTNFPFTLDVLTPSALATTGDNIVDNVEQVIIQSPTSGVYKVSVSYKGVLDDGLQYYALVVSGAAAPPVIEHEPLVNTTNSSSPYLVEAMITSLDPLESSWVFWSTNGFSSVVESNLMVNVSSNLFSASIPAQPLGADVSYYIYTATSNSVVVTDPASAPSVSHSFIVAPGVNLTVYGSPSELGAVSPDYGVWAYPSGVVVHASASAVTPESAGHRYASGGWIGANDVPAEGLSNSVSFLIEHDSAMFWRWDSQYSLDQSSSVVGIFNITNWWKESTMAVSVTAQVAVVHNSISYNFAEWQVDGLRMPDGTNIAVNPVTDLLMATSHVATAIYLPSDEDTDLDGLSDWWERFYFGSLVQTATADPDVDGYTNLEEFEDQSNPRDPLSFPAGPVIVHTALAPVQSNPAPWNVVAVVTDNNFVENVTLRWRRNGLNWRQAVMTETATPDLYTADIPAPGLFDDTFEYTIQATDDSGYFAEDGPHNIFVAYPLISVVQTNQYDFLMFINSLTNSSFSIGNSGNTNLNFQITLESVGLQDDMESGTNSWQHSGQNDNWHITSNRYFSGEYSWYCGNPQNYLYDNGTDAALITDKMLISTNAQLTFMQWIKVELDPDPYAWDGGVIEISLDDGATYQMLTPEGGYPKVVVDNPDSPFATDTPILGGVGGWEEVVVDLSAYSGKEVMIRFRFGSDLFVNDEGWYIDDVVVTPTSSINDTHDWLSLSVDHGDIAASAPDVDISLLINTTNLPPRYHDSLLLAISTDDPTVPLAHVAVSLQIESRPHVELLFAEQLRDGKGQVTISNGVCDLDYDICSLELLYSLDAGVSWTNLTIADVTAELGSVVISNSVLPQLHGIISTNAVGSVTNIVVSRWNSTNGLDAILLETNVLVSCRIWDGKYWSDSVTSQLFTVDNELPSTPASVTVTSHDTGSWSTNRALTFNWSAASDGAGSGIAGYRFAVTNSYTLEPSTTNFTSLLAAVDVAKDDGTNLWATVVAVDAFGNRSGIQYDGPFMVDATPPAEGLVVIEVVTSRFGDYVLGSDVDSSWNGFSDNLSGISGYYIDTVATKPTTNDTWSSQMSAVVSNTTTDQTNTLYLWAIDHAGMVSDAAVRQILVLSEQSDYDNDSAKNIQEDIAGTDANAAESVFTISNEVMPAASNSYMVVSWNSITNRYYTLSDSSSLVHSAWNIVPAVSNLSGLGGVMTYTNSVESDDIRFYKVDVRLP